MFPVQGQCGECWLCVPVPSVPLLSLAVGWVFTTPLVAWYKLVFLCFFYSTSRFTSVFSACWTFFPSYFLTVATLKVVHHIDCSIHQIHRVITVLLRRQTMVFFHTDRDPTYNFDTTLDPEAQKSTLYLPYIIGVVFASYCVPSVVYL